MPVATVRACPKSALPAEWERAEAGTERTRRKNGVTDSADETRIESEDDARLAAARLLNSPSACEKRTYCTSQGKEEGLRREEREKDKTVTYCITI
jgi:hypothetical protein